MEKEEASLFVRIRGTVRPLLPRIHTQGANRPFVIGDFNEYARPTTENSGILQYKMGVLLFIDEQIVPPEMEPQAVYESTASLMCVFKKDLQPQIIVVILKMVRCADICGSDICDPTFAARTLAA
uniref:DUF1336 domain-containing protein n=1 Tax=Globodera pallida TaxID=36090 RepID=A0A183CE07_GLOPA